MIRFHPSSAVVALVAMSASVAHAQALTPQQFIAACRANPANTVLLTQQTKFQTAFQGTTIAAPTGCTVVLGAGVGGSCSASRQGLSAPTIQVCP